MSNSKPSIFVTRRLPQDVEARLIRDYVAELNESDKPFTAEQILAGAEGHDGIICTPTDKIDANLIAQLPHTIKIVATFSVGFDHVDLEAAKDRGLVVTNTPEVLTDATADLTMLLLLGAARRAYEGQKMLYAGEWDGWRPTQLMGTQVSGKRLGILGMGRIGRALADRARGFSMEIHYSDVQRLPGDLEAGATYHRNPEDLLRNSDFFSLNCPATAETRKFLNAERIEMLPQGAIVVNSARGTVVDDEAVIAALKSGRLAAAGLDVFDGEPELNPGYLDLENIFLLPHLGSATIETRNAMGFKALDNLDAFFAGRELPSRVV
jgi:lactate dehydrogenase-like 2-hydroxyacid dehydrogenase